MIINWEFDKFDELLARELQSFIPEKVFDAHMHPYRLKDLNLGGNNVINNGPNVADMNIIRRAMDKFLGQGKFTGGLIIGYPTATCDIDSVNNYVVEQLKCEKESRGSICISPEYSIEKVKKYLENPRIEGLKPYHVFSRQKPTFDSSISDYLPEWAWKIADEKKLAITLHMVKDSAIADAKNQDEIKENCSKYPNVKLILAHAARCFHAPNAKKGLKSLRGLENVWFDMSAICEAEPIQEIIYEFGPQKIMWGSDFPVCMIRGRAVTIGADFVWLQDDSVLWDNLGTKCNPVLIGLESLRALKTAADNIGLNKKDIEDIFYNNAVKLLGIKKETGCNTQELYNHAKQCIPGGTQLLSKRPELMAPGQWPAYYREARGCEVWDIDGKHYYDMSTNGIGSCLLGFRDQDVTSAVIRTVNLGSMCSLNSPDEVELADKLIEIHPWASQVRYTRGGGEACSAAVRIARATTDRSIIAICGYHGWHDWYLAANLGDSDELRGHLLPGLNPWGVPKELRNTALTFKYGDQEAFDKIMDRYGDNIAAVIMEPCRYEDPEKGFLEHVRETTHKKDVLLIFDEVTIGWRLCSGGSHMKFGVYPDIAVFAKALGNGHPIGAVIGTKEAMEGAHISFISSTYWTESVGPAAALATLKKMEGLDLTTHIEKMGSMVKNFWRSCSKKYGLPVVVPEGYGCLAHFSFNHEKSDVLRTLYTQLMLEKGFLAGTTIYTTFAHTPEIIRLYGNAIDEVFGKISLMLKDGLPEKYLKGEPAMSGFRRLNS